MSYKSAIIGYGGMGSWHHDNIKEHIKGIEVVCAYDIRPEVEETVLSKGIRFCKTLEEVLSDPGIDLVTIAVPNNFHKDLSIAAMKAGKHVICEKPVTMNAQELTAIMEVSKETGKLFSIHQNRRWDKDYQMIKKILRDQTIGDPYYIESRVQGSRRMLHGWRGYRENGGGMVYDWGVHLFDQLLDLIPSPVVSVDAQLLRIFSEEVDDNFKVLLRFENGISALVEVATNCFINQPRWHISCMDGTAVIENWNCDGRIVRLSSDEAMTWDDDIVYTAAGPTRTMAPRPKHTVTELPLPEVDTHWSRYYENISAVLDGSTELIVTLEQALRVMNLIDLIFESQDKGCGIACNI